MDNMDAVVVYIMGQSNAHGHAQDMCREDMVLTPMKHVFSLDRRENQFYGLDKITWSGYTSCGKNLGESQDHIYNLAYFLAAAWEKLAEEKKMPDLYIVQISVGAQAVVNGLRFPGCGMWNPEHERVIKPGGWEEADIGLYHLAMEILPLVHKDLTARYGKVKALGLHWIGNEDDAGVGAVYPEDFDQRYDRFFDDVLSAIGFACPLYFYKMLCTRREGFTPHGIEFVNAQHARLCRRIPNATLYDLRQSDIWDEEDPCWGVFSPDMCHYRARTQKFLAQRFLDESL